MTMLPDGIDRYFLATDRAFAALDQVYRPDAGPWGKRHDIVYGVVQEYLERLRNSFRALHLHCHFADSFKIDIKDSGFPIFRHMLEIQEDVGQADKMLEDLEPAGQIRHDMLDALLKQKRFPTEQQKAMAQRLYFETLSKGHLFLQRSTPRTVRWSVNKRNKRPFYVVRWASYDGVSNLPMAYIAVIEDSSDDAEPPPKRGGKKNKKSGSEPSAMRGLPNRDVSEAFIEFAAKHSSYSLNLTSIATALDQDFKYLHPKQIRRIVMGPFCAGGLTSHNEKVNRILEGVGDPGQSWLLNWTMQEIHSQEEKPAKWGLWGGTQAQEIYFVDTADIDCVQHGVSAMERHALVPHEAYQAAYAHDPEAGIFDGYDCHIVTEDNILRHI